MKTISLDALMSDTRTTAVVEQLLSMMALLGARHGMFCGTIKIGMSDSIKLAPTVKRDSNPDKWRGGRLSSSTALSFDHIDRRW